MLRLSLEEAIRMHREMWMWIRGNSYYRKRCMTKTTYFNENPIDQSPEHLRRIVPEFCRPYNKCFLCDFVIEHNKEHKLLCEYCPVRWPTIDRKYGIPRCHTKDDTGLFDDFQYELSQNDWAASSVVAEEIAKLPLNRNPEIQELKIYPYANIQKGL